MLVTACLAAVVTVAGLVYAFFQRPSGQSSDQGAADANLICGTTVCQSVIGKGVGGDNVELLTGTGGGRIRVTGESGNFIFEMTIAAAGAEVSGDKALECAPAAVSVCLVRGTRGSEVLGEALVRRNGAWERLQATYLASGGYLGLFDANRDGTSDVVAVQLGCDGRCDQAFVQVFDPLGPEVRCTAPVASKDEANVRPELAQLRACAQS
ncbi:hypothetical protein Lesp02_78390 [Lentzea sp. NBRC 105346]|nr:hypothetical protein Lesp02_78390 [Lentzea sp. NBRC 105346]